MIPLDLCRRDVDDAKRAYETPERRSFRMERIMASSIQDIGSSSEDVALINGTGAYGVIEVSDRVKSINYFLHMPFRQKKKKHDTLMNEFVWDPVNLRFAAIRRGKTMKSLTGYSPHEALAKAIGADFNKVCGGIIRMTVEGDNTARSLATTTVLETSEFSGHFHQNWTDEIRAQYKAYMERRTGLTINHHPGM